MMIDVTLIKKCAEKKSDVQLGDFSIPDIQTIYRL